MGKILLATVFGWMMLPGAANADLLYTLDISDCCGSGPFGQIQLQQVDANTVRVIETLAAGNIFPGAPQVAPSLSFNVAKSFSYVAGTLTAGFTSGGANTSSPFGSFGFFVDCTDNTVCDIGVASLFGGPLTFEITNAGGLALSDFVANADGYFFATNIGTKSGEFLTTGSVASNKSQTTGVIPEPASVLLLATAAGSALWISRKRRAA